MEIIRLSLPWQFISERTQIDWHDVQFGLENELVDPEVARGLARTLVRDLEEPAEAVYELAFTDNMALLRTCRLVGELAEQEQRNGQVDPKEKWLYLVLAWFYERKDQDPDPLERVVEVYADFGYPEKIAAFVKWMPMTGPDLGSIQRNEQRMFERWRLFLYWSRRALANAPRKPF